MRIRKVYKTIDTLSKLFNIKSKRHKHLEELYFDLRAFLTSCSCANNDAVCLERDTIKECFQLLDCYISGNPNDDVELKNLSNDFKKNPNLIAKLILPRLLTIRNNLTREQIHKFD